MENLLYSITRHWKDYVDISFPLEAATHRSMNSLKHKRSLLWWRKSLGSAGISFKKTWATSNGPCRDTQNEKSEEKASLSPTVPAEKMNASSTEGHKVKSTHKGKIMNKSLCEWCHREARSRGIAALFLCSFSKGHLSYNHSHTVSRGLGYVLNLISVVNCHSGASDFTINIETLGTSVWIPTTLRFTSIFYTVLILTKVFKNHTGDVQ